MLTKEAVLSDLHVTTQDPEHNATEERALFISGLTKTLYVTKKNVRYKTTTEQLHFTLHSVAENCEEA